MDVPLEILDREVARAAGRWTSARAEIDRGEAPWGNPLEPHRRVSSRATWIDLAPPPPPAREPGAPPPPPRAPRYEDTLREALRSWVAVLTLGRVLWPDAVRVEAARRARGVEIEHPEIDAVTLSPRELGQRILVEKERVRRRLWGEALERGAGAVGEALRIEAARRAEAAHRLPIDLDDLEIPVDLPADSAFTSRGAFLAHLARDFLRRTEPLAPALPGPWPEALAALLGRSFAEGWPARLTSRWLEDLFRPTGLTDGLRPALGPLPAALGASSFARALAAFGAALAAADGPRGLPFVLAAAPYDLRRARRAALFGGLVADPIFNARALGLGRGRALDQARGVGRALLGSLRLAAARVLCRGALARGDRSAFEEATGLALGVAIPPSLGGVIPRLSPEDPATFLGALLAASDRRALVHRFDEDWFKSPHAAHALREEDAEPPALRAPAAAAEAGLGALVDALGDLG